MKKLTLMFFFVLLLVTTIYASDFDIDVVSSPATLNPGATLTINLTLDLDALATPGAFNLAVSATVPGLTLPALNPSQILFQVGTTTLTLVIPSNASPGLYTGMLRAEQVGDSSHFVTDDFQFTVNEVRDVELKLNNNVVTSISTGLEAGEDENELTLTLKNTGNSDLSNVQVSTIFTTLADDDGDVIVITNPTVITSMARDETRTVLLNFDVETGFDVQSLSGIIRVVGDSLTVKEFPLTLNIKPLACQPNSRTGDLDLNAEKPDEDTEFERGDLLEVELEIENNGNRDVDARVEAVLYDLENNRKEDSTTLTRNIDDDESETVNFNLDMGDNIDDGDRFTLYLKVFDRDEELASCRLEEISLEVEVPDHKLKIEDLTLSPSTASCNSQVTGTALLRNVGDSDEEVIVEVYNNQLGISRVSPLIEIEEEAEQLINFGFILPGNAQAGSYQIFVSTDYDGEEAITSKTLTVTECIGPEDVQTTSEEENLNAQIIGGATSRAVGYSEKDLFDIFNRPDNNVPILVWILVDVLLVLLIIGSLAWLFRSK